MSIFLESLHRIVTLIFSHQRISSLLKKVMFLENLRSDVWSLLLLSGSLLGTIPRRCSWENYFHDFVEPLRSHQWDWPAFYSSHLPFLTNSWQVLLTNSLVSSILLGKRSLQLLVVGGVEMPVFLGGFLFNISLIEFLAVLGTMKFTPCNIWLGWTAQF